MLYRICRQERCHYLKLNYLLLWKEWGNEESEWWGKLNEFEFSLDEKIKILDDAKTYPKIECHPPPKKFNIGKTVTVDI